MSPVAHCSYYSTTLSFAKVNDDLALHTWSMQGGIVSDRHFHSKSYN